MRNFPTVGILINGDRIIDQSHPVFNLYSVSIASCKSALNKKLIGNQTTTIYVMEEADKVFCELPDGTTMEFFG